MYKDMNNLIVISHVNRFDNENFKNDIIQKTKYSFNNLGKITILLKL